MFILLFSFVRDYNVKVTFLAGAPMAMLESLLSLRNESYGRWSCTVLLGFCQVPLFSVTSPVVLGKTAGHVPCEVRNLGRYWFVVLCTLDSHIIDVLLAKRQNKPCAAACQRSHYHTDY
jgi:hypothetical protein